MRERLTSSWSFSGVVSFPDLLFRMHTGLGLGPRLVTGTLYVQYTVYTHMYTQGDILCCTTKEGESL